MPAKKIPVKKSAKAIADTQRSINRASKANARQAELARTQAAKNLKVAFKNAKQQRDQFGRFLAKLKRDARGLFVSGKATVAAKSAPEKKAPKTPVPSPKPQSKKLQSQPSKVLGAKPKAGKIPVAKPSQTPPSKVGSKRSTTIQSGKVYSVRDFPFAKGENMAQWVNTIDENAEEINSQLQQGEMFAGYANGYRTAVLYENIEQLTNKFNEYVDHHWNDEEEKQKFIKTLKIVKFPGDNGEYARKRRVRMEENSKEARKVLKAARADLGETVREVDHIGKKRIVLERKKSTTELLKERNAESARLKAELEDRDKRLAALEANMKRLEALIGKRAVKKTATKKAAKKTAKKKVK
jgi:hypothetical protein